MWGGIRRLKIFGGPFTRVGGTREWKGITPTTNPDTDTGEKKPGLSKQNNSTIPTQISLIMV